MAWGSMIFPLNPPFSSGISQPWLMTWGQSMKQSLRRALLTQGNSEWLELSWIDLYKLTCIDHNDITDNILNIAFQLSMFFLICIVSTTISARKAKVLKDMASLATSIAVCCWKCWWQTAWLAGNDPTINRHLNGSIIQRADTSPSTYGLRNSSVNSVRCQMFRIVSESICWVAPSSAVKSKCGMCGAVVIARFLQLDKRPKQIRSSLFQCQLACSQGAEP